MLISDFVCEHCESIATNEIIQNADDTIECKFCHKQMTRVFGNMDNVVRDKKKRMIRMKDDWKGRGTPYPKGKERAKRFITKLRSKKLGL